MFTTGSDFYGVLHSLKRKSSGCLNDEGGSLGRTVVHHMQNLPSKLLALVMEDIWLWQAAKDSVGVLPRLASGE